MNRLVSGVLAAALVTAGLAVATVPAEAACRPSVTDLRLPSDFRGGEEARGRVTLSCAPRSAVDVRLSHDGDTLRLPGSVRVRAGRRSAAFEVLATRQLSQSYVARVTARLDGSRVRNKLRVDPGLRLVEIPQSSSLNGVSINVIFTGPLPEGGATVRVRSSDPAVTVPRRHTFPAGSYGGGVPFVEVAPVDKDTRISVSVTYGRRTLTDSKTLTRTADPATVGVTLSRPDGGRVYGASWSEQYDVRLDAPAPEGGLTFQWRIRDDNPAAWVDSRTSSITAGSTWGSNQLNFTDVTSSTPVVLQVLLGERTFELPITIHPRVTEIQVPSTVVGGQDFVGTVVLAGPSDVDTVVGLQASWSIVDVQNSVRIPAGQTSATFTGTTLDVDEPADVFVSGSYGRNQLQSEFMTLLP